MESPGRRVNGARDHVRREDMSGVRVGIAKEVGEGDGWKGVVVVKGGLKELDHYGKSRRCICDTIVLGGEYLLTMLMDEEGD
jgi:hypothetical protein